MPAENKPILTDRDAKVLLDIYKHRYLSVSQIQSLHFPSLQTAYRRLRNLKGVGHIKGFNVPSIPEQLFCLTKSGAELVAGSLNLDSSELKWKDSTGTPKDYYFIQHFLKINDFRIALTKATQDSDIKLLGFIPDYYGEKTNKGGLVKYIKEVVCDIKNRDEQISHTPDGVFALEKDHKPALFFLEIDRGTETISDKEKGVLKAFRFYLNFLVVGKYQRYKDDFRCPEFQNGFKALFVTTSEERLKHFKEAAEELEISNQLKRFIWLTTDEKIKPETLLGPNWQSLDIEDREVYKIN